MGKCGGGIAVLRDGRLRIVVLKSRDLGNWVVRCLLF